MATKTGGARNSKRLTKDELFEALKTRREEFEVGGLGTILIESISVDRFAAAQGSLGDVSTSEATKRICLLGIVEPALDADDLEALGKVDVGALTRISNKIMRLSGLLGEEASRFLTSTTD